MNKVLFLCTGNYYRSRFAELLFNCLAEDQGLPWRAESRGLEAVTSRNLGPISHFALAGLRACGIPAPARPRPPMQLAAADLEAADLVVCLKEAEHRAMLVAQYPAWTGRVEYWHIDDLDCATASEALPCLHREVFALVARLGEAAGDGEAA